MNCRRQQPLQRPMPWPPCSSSSPWYRAWEAAAEEAAAEHELELNEMRGKLALAETERVGPLLEV